MAQWSGGFSGNTHATRVAEAEAALRHAITVLQAKQPGEDPTKAANTVHKLAQRVLSSRLRMLKARLSTMQDAKAQDAVPSASQELTDLRRRLALAQTQGVKEVLDEFSASGLLKGD